MGVPLGDGGQKKFNWASELSTWNNNSSSQSRVRRAVSRLAPIRSEFFLNMAIEFKQCAELD